MSTPESLKDLLVTILRLKKELTESDTEKVKVDQKTYQKLLDGFYEEYLDMMVPDQYKETKNDPNYFLVLIQLAYHKQEQQRVDNRGDQSLSYSNLKLFTQRQGAI